MEMAWDMERSNRATIKAVYQFLQEDTEENNEHLNENSEPPK
jgi:hypothetical protein